MGEAQDGARLVDRPARAAYRRAGERTVTGAVRVSTPGERAAVPGGADTGTARADGRPGAGFRPDIEGMRALAVLLVVVFHTGLGPLAGGFVGVDVFFVISGFLITGLLMDEARRTGTIDLPVFYARRVRRLLPMATLVLVATTIAFRLVLPPLDRGDLGAAVTAATFWSANWFFAAEQTDYMGDVDRNPVLHYWSLSVEEQFYVVWPLLLLAALWLRRRSGRGDLTRWIAGALAVLGTGSLAMSVLLTRDSGPWAYFGVHTRAWELAAGAGLALARPLAGRIPRAAALVAGWGGLALVVAGAAVLDRSTSFPGTAALWPVAGTALLIAAGARSRSGASALLSLPVLTYLGRVSYGWYLWHWPCLQLAREIADRPGNAAQATEGTGGADPGPLAIGLAVVISLALAMITNRLVEQPVRRCVPLLRSSRRSLVLGGTLLTAAVAGSCLLLNSPVRVLGPDPTGTLRQSPEQARADDQTVARCSVPFDSVDADPNCLFGDADGGKVVVLFGDSHAAQWFGALDEAARQRHWRLYVWTKSGCGYSDARQWLGNYRREYTECAAWREAALSRIEALPRVDAVLIGRNVYQLNKLVGEDGNLSDEKTAGELWERGADRVLRRLHTRAKQVVLMRDTPRPLDDLPACVSEHLDDPGRCDFPLDGHADLDRGLFATEQAVVDALGTRVMATTPIVCPGGACPAVSDGGHLTYKDDNHLTGSYSRELGDAVGDWLMPLLGPDPTGEPDAGPTGTRTASGAAGTAGSSAPAAGRP